MMDFVLKMMDFVLKMVDFTLKMVNFTSKMMNFISKMMNITGVGYGPWWLIAAAAPTNPSFSIESSMI